MLDILGSLTLLGRCEWVIWVWPIRSLEIIIFLSSVTCWPFTYGILNMIELFLCLYIAKFLLFLEYTFFMWL